MSEKLRELCKEYISEELEARGTSVNTSDLDGLVENMASDVHGNLNDLLERMASDEVSKYEQETQA